MIYAHAFSHKNYRADLRENSTTEVTVNFWKSPGSGAGSEIIFLWILPPWETKGAIQRILTTTRELTDEFLWNFFLNVATKPLDQDSDLRLFGGKFTTAG